MTTLERVRTDARPVPDWLRGAWRRRLLRTADGADDRTTDVLWVQTASLFADIRVSSDRPDLSARRGVEDCTGGELVAAASTKAFAGWTTFEGEICRWFRPIDFRPPTGQEDTGRMELREGSLWERGLAGDYSEEYRRDADGSRSTAAWTLESDSTASRPGVIVIVDEFVMRAVGRTEPLPQGADLPALIEERAADRPALERLFDCEISLALATDLIVRRSTLPWREHRRLAPRGAFVAGPSGDLLLEDHPAGRRRWRRCDGGSDAQAMAALLNA